MEEDLSLRFLRTNQLSANALFFCPSSPIRMLFEIQVNKLRFLRNAVVTWVFDTEQLGSYSSWRNPLSPPIERAKRNPDC